MASLIEYLEIEPCLRPPPQQSLTSETQSITLDLLVAQRNPSEFLAGFVGPETVEALRDLANLSREMLRWHSSSHSSNVRNFSPGEAKNRCNIAEQAFAIEALLTYSDGQVTQAAANQVGERFFSGLWSLSNGTDQFDERIESLQNRLDSFRIAISNSRNTGSDFSNLTTPEGTNSRQQGSGWLFNATTQIPELLNTHKPTIESQD